MKIRVAGINGSMGWCVDCVVRDGKRRRESYLDEAKAKAALQKGIKDQNELGRR